MPQLIREEPISKQSIAAADGTQLFKFARPERVGMKTAYVNKIALSMNQEQHFALVRAHFYTKALKSVHIGDKYTTGSSLLASFIFSPPIVWDINDALWVFIIINSGTVTVVDALVYWSFEK
ncbi:hypothetical protein ES705_27035 [subsurface metagenome]